MKKYIIIPVVISILAHGIFFGVFKGTLPAKAVLSRPKLYIIPSGQIKHEMASDVTLAPLSSRLSGRNELWADTLSLSGGIPPGFIPHAGHGEESVLLLLEKTHMLRKLPLAVEWRMSSGDKVLPRFGDLLYHRLPSEIVRGEVEQVISLGNNTKFVYYIVGPVSGRGLHLRELPPEVEGVTARIKLRFWVADNGRVNQVIIEEGSGFPVIDKKIVAAVKKWRFSPVYIPQAPGYQWGVMKIRLQG